MNRCADVRGWRTLHSTEGNSWHCL